MPQEGEHIGAFGPGEEGASAMKSGMERAWYAHMAGLRSSYTRAVTANPTLRDPRIDTLLDPVLSDHACNATNWTIPNEIEVLLVRLMTGAELEVVLDSAFATAQTIMVPTAAVLAKRRETAVTDDDKQAVLAKLLGDTHNRYAARRSERMARRAVANRMTRLGFGLTVMIVGSFILFGSEALRNLIGLPVFDPTKINPFADLVKYNLCVTTFFGFLGAYLSRLIAFQKTAQLLSYEELENSYSWNFLMVRLLVGGLSSVIVYFVISGRLIGGELFPEVQSNASGGFGPMWTTLRDGNLVYYDGPSANYAKLIVWCFISGFSERFLPDHLSALEAKSKA